MMRQILWSALSLIMICLYGCTGGKTENSIMVVGDTVAMATISLHDTASYFITDNKKCNISADVEITYPKYYKDKECTEKLQKMYSTNILNIISDSVSLASAFPEFVDNLINQYKESSTEVVEGVIESDYEPMSECNLQVKIYPVYNACGTLSICKEEVALIDDNTPARLHFYNVFNLPEMKKLETSDIFPEEALSQVIEALKTKLRSDLNVANDDELADMGYYNFDNLKVSENFYLTADSIVWNFLPRELSVLEEVKISLGKKDILY